MIEREDIEKDHLHRERMPNKAVVMAGVLQKEVGGPDGGRVRERK